MAVKAGHYDRDFDPWDREGDAAAAQLAAAREDHQLWSLAQAKKGNDAAHRESAPTWAKRAPILEELES